MKQLDFGKGSIVKNITAAAIPMLIAQLVNLLYNLIDRVYIGRIPEVGTKALGGLGLTFPIIILITAFTNLYAGGGAPLFAIALGEKNEKRANAILRITLFLEVGTALVLMLVGILAAKPILTLFGAGEEALFFSLPYIRIYLIGTVFSMVAIGMNPFINAQGFPTYGMISVIVGAILNIILDPIFIFPMGLGISGAAIATVISQFVSAAVVLCILRSKKMPLPLHVRVKKTEQKIRKKRALKLILSITSLGLAAFVMQFTNALVSVVCNAVLSRIGGHIYISVMTVISSLRQVFETPMLAICEGSSPMISYNYGAMNFKRVRASVKVMSILTLSYTFIIWCLMMAFPAVFIAIFSSDKNILADAIPATRIYFCTFLFMALQFLGQTTYKAVSNRKRSIFFSIFRKVILVVPLTYILPMFFSKPTDGVFAAEPLSNIIGGSASFFTMLVYIRKLDKEG
ncbi:MAG: MATE family efflux transporter [Eubacterium sp.]|nr:MATE family efflux transporter [Eubacterium sp.]